MDLYKLIIAVYVHIYLGLYYSFSIIQSEYDHPPAQKLVPGY